MKRRSFLSGSTAGLAAGLALPALVPWGLAPVALAQSDALPSWNDGPAKQSILDFVSRTTTNGSRDWVPVPERIACFDNDGTLWTEQPMYFQVMFAFDRVKAMVGQHPEWRTREPFRSILADDRAALAALGPWRINCFGHLGDGNLHYNVFPPKGERPALYQNIAPAVQDLVHTMVIDRGGSFSAEHGIGRLKVAELERFGDPAKLAAMRAIKAALDPYGIMNPGAVLR